MITHTLNILLYHSMRSANHLRMSEEDPSDEKIAAYVQTRATMLEKLTDYAVGTQSMACEEVKRAVSRNTTVMAVGSTDPTSCSLSLSLSWSIHSRLRLASRLVPETEDSTSLQRFAWKWTMSFNPDALALWKQR